MADETKEKAEGEADAPAPKKKNPLVMIGIIAGVLVVLTGGSFVAITKLMPAPEAAPVDSTAIKAKNPLEGRVKLEVKDLIMNPADKGSPRFVKVSLVFELKDQKSADALAGFDYRVRDLVIALVSRKTADELSTPEVRDNLRLQIMDEMNSSVMSGNILDVFFTDYIVQ